MSLAFSSLVSSLQYNHSKMSLLEKTLGVNCSIKKEVVKVRMEKDNIEGTDQGVQIPYYLFCLHKENGSTDIPKICTRNYECRHCAFDQWLDEMEGRHTAEKNHKFFRHKLAKAA